MTTVTVNNGTTGDILGLLFPADAFSGPITLTSFSDTQFTIVKDGRTLTVTGSGLAYDSSGLTSGTITGATLAYASLEGSGKSQNWSNLSVSAVAAWQAVATGNQNAFANLFFGGDDIFNVTGRIDSIPGGSGLAGNDTYNLNSMASSGLHIDAGAGNDTVNFNAGFSGGDIRTGPYANNSNVDFVGVETVNLSPGFSYTLIPGTQSALAGTTLTINGSALGAGDKLVFSTFTNFVYDIVGSLVLLGGAGDDYLEGGYGNDILNGGAGNDTVSYLPLELNNTGVNVSLAISGPQSVGGHGGTDTLIGIENLIGTPVGDTLTGDSGNNILDGAGGTDILDGGAGNDTASFAHSTYSVNASLATGIGTGGGTATFISIENLTGSPYDDTLEGDSGNNVLDGGLGKDTVTYAKATGGITVDMTRTGPQAIGGSMGSDTLVSIERVIGSNYDDTFIAGVNSAVSNNAGIYYLDGSSFVGGTGFDTVDLSKLPGPAVWANSQDVEHIIGTSFNDTLVAPFGDAILEGGDGNDSLSTNSSNFGGSNGTDTMLGGAGDDVITVYNFDSTDKIDGGSGNDRLIIGSFSAPSLTLTPTMIANIETVQFQVSAAPTVSVQDAAVAAGATLTVIANGGLTFDGSAETDGSFVVKGGGNATLTGGQKDDTLSAGLGTNDLNGGAGFDYASYADAGGPVTVSLAIAGPQTTYTDPRYVGTNTATDTLVNIEGLIGSSYNDTLTGNSGNNTLVGGAGNDILDGGAGFDTTVFSGNRSSYSIATSGQVVTVSGPDGTDTLLGIERMRFADQTVDLQTTVSPSASLDLDGDGKPDLLWRNDSNAFSKWGLNGATATSTTDLGASSSSWAMLGSGDFNGDGKGETLWHHVNGAVEIDGVGATGFVSLGVPGSIDSSWSVAALGDFNGDGKIDILWHSTANAYAVWQMNGATAAAKTDMGTVNASWTVMGAGDFDGNGKSEILWRNQSGSIEIDAVGATGFSGIGVIGNLDAGWSAAALGDFNGDGKTDILWRSSANDYSEWLMNGATVTAKVDLGITSSGWSVQSWGDFNGDGKAEVLWHHVNGTVEADSLGAAGFFGLGVPGVLGTSWSAAGNANLHKQLADFNGDGKADILWRSSGGAYAEWQIGVGFTSSETALGSLNSNWSLDGAGDFNGDGKAEVVWHHVNGTVEIDSVGASGFVGVGVAGNLDSSWSAAAIGDFDGNGKADILWRNGANAYSEWKMNGATVTAKVDLGTASASWSVEGAGDFNGDGKTDVLWRHVNGTVEIDAVSDSDFSSLGVAGNIDSSWSVAALGDFNGDGKTDILWRSSANAYSEWLMNGATVTTKVDIGPMSSAWSVEGAGDVNGDGKAEILWRNANGNVEIDGLGVPGFANVGVVGSISSSWQIASQTNMLVAGQ